MSREDFCKMTSAERGVFSSPAMRVLIVAEAIGSHGPITLNRLAELLPFHRSSVWRAASILKSHGWVRTRRGDNAFELTSHLDLRLANFHFAPADVECAESLIATILRDDQYHAELCQFIAPGRFVMIESSCRSPEREGLRSLVWDGAAMAAQLAMTPSVLRRHLKAYCTNASRAEREIVNSGEHMNTLARYQCEGVIWSPDTLEASLPWVGASGSPGAVTVIAKFPSRRTDEKLRVFAQYLKEIRPDVVGSAEDSRQ